VTISVGTPIWGAHSNRIELDQIRRVSIREAMP
jgi:hypothetical protein